MKKLIYIIPVLLFFVSCKKNEVSDVPEIEFVSSSSSSIQHLSESVTFTLSYKDGNGDLGENTPGVKNCFLKDSRGDIQLSYRIQQLAPDGSSVAIKGNLEVVVEGLGVIDDNANSETVSFEIYVTDRAGNQSNKVTSETITINR